MGQSIHSDRPGASRAQVRPCIYWIPHPVCVCVCGWGGGGWGCRVHVRVGIQACIFNDGDQWMIFWVYAVWVWENVNGFRWCSGCRCWLRFLFWCCACKCAQVATDSQDTKHVCAIRKAQNAYIWRELKDMEVDNLATIKMMDKWEMIDFLLPILEKGFHSHLQQFYIHGKDILRVCPFDWTHWRQYLLQFLLNFGHFRNNTIARQYEYLEEN